jgi:hypothetical protein
LITAWLRLLLLLLQILVLVMLFSAPSVDANGWL